MSEGKHSHPDEEDDRTITLPEHRGSPRSLGPAMSLDLAGTSSDVKTDSGENEDEIVVVFELPDGSQSDSKFRLGQTVEVLKSFVESEFGIPMQGQTLRLKGKVMMDPLSLLDFSEIRGTLPLVLSS